MTTPSRVLDAHVSTGRRALRAMIWLPALLVALGAATATAHGLYEVARASGAPGPIAALYPLITDGLALVAYASTVRLTGSGRRYAWIVVVLAAGLSGLAQASYLAGGVATAPTELRFGVGAWPAVAAAIVGHLLFLIGTASRPGTVQLDPRRDAQDRPMDGVQSVQSGVVQAVQHANGRAVQTTSLGAVQANHRDASKGESTRGGSPKDRALGVARRQVDTAGVLPSSRELANLAAVSRGTAASALQQLRNQPAPVASDGESSAEA